MYKMFYKTLTWCMHKLSCKKCDLSHWDQKYMVTGRWGPTKRVHIQWEIKKSCMFILYSSCSLIFGHLGFVLLCFGFFPCQNCCKHKLLHAVSSMEVWRIFKSWSFTDHQGTAKMKFHKGRKWLVEVKGEGYPSNKKKFKMSLFFFLLWFLTWSSWQITLIWKRKYIERNGNLWYFCGPHKRCYEFYKH